MAALRHLVRRQAWLLGTVAGAALAFVATFFVVSAVAENGDSPAAAAPAAPLVAAPLAPPGGTPTEPPPTESTPPEPSEPEPEPAQPAAEPPEPPPPPEEEPTATLPEFDESALIHGGSGNEGAILAGVGIVASSGSDRATDWELLLPSALIKADIVRVGLALGGALGAPDNPFVIGWWENGPAPGEPGNVLLDGHRDYRDTEKNVGTGVCWLLPETQLDDLVLIRDHVERQYYLYTVIEVVSLRWDAPEGVDYLRQSERSLLTLITCEGSFDRDARNYSSRRIVVAELTDTVPFPAESGDAPPE